MDRLLPKFRELFAAVLVEVRSNPVATTGWRDGVASAAGVRFCEFAERLATDLKG